jgi:hypothetical protein
MKRTIIAVSGAMCALVSIASFGGVPVTFSAGTPAKANEVNANFQNLDGRVTNAVGTITVSPVQNSGTGFATAFCPQNTLVISASGDCSDENGTRNFGVLFSVDTAGNGGFVGCIPEGTTFNPSKPEPLAKITIRCLGAANTNGQTLPSFAISKSLESDDELKRAEQDMQVRTQQHNQELIRRMQ